MATGTDPTTALNALIDEGLTFGQVVSAFAARRTDQQKKYVEAAIRDFYDGGRIEVDEEAIVSGSSDAGDYVMAWVWVTDEAAGVASDEQSDVDFPLPDLTSITAADQATQLAIDWQTWQSDQSLSQGEMLHFQGFFEELAAKFGLADEFRENGII